MTYRPLSREALEQATRRLDDFYRVHKGDDDNDRVEALDVLISSFGDGDAWVDLSDYFRSRGGLPKEEGALFLGFLMGLLVAQVHEES